MIEVERLLRGAESLHARLPNAAARLEATVLRPLRAALGDTPRTDPSTGLSDDPATGMRELALAATSLVRTSASANTDVLEAAAGLARLACDLAASDDYADALRDELHSLTSGTSSRIRVKKDGPYLALNVATLRTYLGENLPTCPVMALCRCGASATKPFCDGSHASNGFTGDRDPKRVADHRDEYKGVALTVLDNRGTCAHAGFCSDRLKSVFHVSEEPFVSASGGRLDEIVRAVRACPSGALSFALDGKEQRAIADTVREPAIEISKDGPYRVSGAIPLHGDDDHPEPRNDGASFEHYSMCRCGRSQNKPFCSGMHWTVSFRDPVATPESDPTLFEWAGGYPAILRMSQIFYSKYVPQDPLLSPLFGHMSPDHPERVAAWLSEVFGGPPLFSERYGGYERMLTQHLGKSLREEQRSRWAQLMYQSADDAGLPADAEFRAAFAGYVEWGSRIALENSQPGAKPPPKMPMPHWWWVCNATPKARVSALASTEETPVALPAEGETPSFATHVKGCFRAMDRASMKFAFDLWVHSDVAKHAAAILQRLEAGTMPCDGPWPKEKIEVFRRWIDQGTPE
jgi:CDGSH-type Zn-finger protein/truncated hemoglobin YjbI